MRPILAIYILFLSTGSLSAQVGILTKKVTFEYKNTRLKEALTDLTQRYQIPFSYSTEQVNVRQRITATAADLPLSAALDKLFENITVSYMLVGNHIVLRNDPTKPISKTTGSKQSVPRKKTPEPETPTEPTTILVKQEEPPIMEEVPPPPNYDSVSALQMPDVQPISSEESTHPFDQTLLNFEKWRYQSDAWTRRSPTEKRIAQVSVLPFIGTNTRQSDDVTNNLSMNLLWGVNGGVSGMEVGGGINMVKKDMAGFQVAGLGNKVNRNVTGTQFGGVFNYAGGTTKGFQAAGVVNFANNAEAAQAAGLANMVRGDVTGIQASGLFNVVGGDARALQASGLFNKTGGDSKFQAAGAFNRSRGSSKFQAAGAFNLSRGNTNFQISSLLNTANDVKVGQFGTFNRARGEMRGLQIGLINISDTVSGVPIGLINIVKRGYNKFEIYGSEILHGNFQLKLGANAFYNIFHVGARVPPGDGSYVWGLGYGIGTVTTLSQKSTLNWELMAIHISENEPWTNILNSIGQFRFLWNHQLGKSIGFFIGPTANVMVSQLRNPETGEIRSPVVAYTLLDEDLTQKTNLKAWVGVNAGFRF